MKSSKVPLFQNPIKTRSNYTYLVIFGIIVFIVIVLANVWAVDVRNYFLADDYDHLLTVMKFRYVEIFHILPIQRYNDRPVGIIIIKILFSLFRLKSGYYHIVFLFTHIFNCLLVFFLVRKLVENFKKQKYTYLPILSAAIFGIWPISLHAVSWVAAVFDMYSATFLLIVLNLYLYKIHSKYRYLWWVLIFFVFFLALRTKEVAIIIPVLLLIYELFYYLYTKDYSLSELKEFRPSILTVLLLCVSFTYFYYLFYHTSSAFTMEPSSQYFFSYNPLVIIKNYLKYWYLFFDFSNGGQEIYMGANILSAVISFSLFLLLLFSALLLAVKKSYFLILFFVLIFVTLLPVLPMKNFQYVLYLYIPSIFLSVMLASVVVWICNRYIGNQKIQLVVMILVVVGMYILTFTPRVKTDRNFRLSIGLSTLNTAADLARLQSPQHNSTIYILNVTDNYSSFFIRQGAVNNLVFKDLSLKTVVNPVFINKNASFVVVEYSAYTGHIREIERSR